MEDLNFRKGDAKTDVFGSNRMLQPSPVEKIPDGPTTPEIAYQMVKDETFAQTQPRLNLATFVTHFQCFFRIEGCFFQCQRYFTHFNLP